MGAGPRVGVAGHACGRVSGRAWLWARGCRRRWGVPTACIKASCPPWPDNDRPRPLCSQWALGIWHRALHEARDRKRLLSDMQTNTCLGEGAQESEPARRHLLSGHPRTSMASMPTSRRELWDGGVEAAEAPPFRTCLRLLNSCLTVYVLRVVRVCLSSVHTEIQKGRLEEETQLSPDTKGSRPACGQPWDTGH